MSYSFIVRAATRAEAKVKVSAQLDQVVQSQPVHRADRQQAQEAANAFTDLLTDDPTKDVMVTLSGSVGWTDEDKFTSAAVQCNAYLANKEA